MNSLEDILSCIICFEKFKRPKALPCQHFFCAEPCLTNISKNGKISCPICRNEFDVPLKGFPANFVIEKLLDLTLEGEQKSHQESRRSSRVCPKLLKTTPGGAGERSQVKPETSKKVSSETSPLEKISFENPNTKSRNWSLLFMDDTCSKQLLSEDQDEDFKEALARSLNPDYDFVQRKK